MKKQRKNIFRRILALLGTVLVLITAMIVPTYATETVGEKFTSVSDSWMPYSGQTFTDDIQKIAKLSWDNMVGMDVSQVEAYNADQAEVSTVSYISDTPMYLKFYSDGSYYMYQTNRVIFEYWLDTPYTSDGYYLYFNVYADGISNIEDLWTKSYPMIRYNGDAKSMSVRDGSTTYVGDASVNDYLQFWYPSDSIECVNALYLSSLGNVNGPIHYFYRSLGSSYTLEYPYLKLQSYSDGYNDGYDWGREEGYLDGYDQGFSEGETEGYTAGESAGYEKGYSLGYAEGQDYGESLHASDYENGYDEGMTDGYNNGYDYGYDDGHQAGYSEGYVIGETAGFQAGEAHGITETSKTGSQLRETIFAIVESPIRLIEGVLDFDILGFNLASLVKSIITIVLVAAIVFIIFKFVK